MKKALAVASAFFTGFALSGVESLQAFLLKHKNHPIGWFLCLARLKGLEPLTYWFVASHSIQLSYKRRY